MVGLILSLQLAVAGDCDGGVGRDPECDPAVERTVPFNLSLAGPLALVPTPKKHVELLSVNLLHGSSWYVDGLQVGLLVNHTRRQLRGVEVGGAFNFVLGDAYGLQFSLMSNMVRDHMRGVQLAGIVNVAGEVRGLQLTPVVNFAFGDAHGLQLGLLGNGATELTGWQLGLFNGVQTAGPRLMQIGAVNFASEGVPRLLVQVSPTVNYLGGSGRGLQVGIMNWTFQHFSGLRVGLVNISGESVATFTPLDDNTFWDQYNPDREWLKTWQVDNSAVVSGLSVAALMQISPFARGLQVSPINVTHQGASGVELGLLNINGGNLRGAQVGAVNITGTLTGVQLGVLNIAFRQKLPVTVLINAGAWRAPSAEARVEPASPQALPAADAPSSPQETDAAPAAVVPFAEPAGVEGAARDLDAAPIAYEMVRIEPGVFTMGSSSGDSDETPHEVRLDHAFQLGATEVPSTLYARLMGEDPSTGWGCTPRCPTSEVPWLGAVQFCNALSVAEGLQPAYRITGEQVEWVRSADGYRLPTEAEWEYAARAGEAHRYAGSDSVAHVAWYSGNLREGTGYQAYQAVRAREPNAWGLYDMSGNVWELVWDWYGPYPEGTVVDPRGPDAGEARVMRGGCYSDLPDSLRVANRFWADPTEGLSNVGFRLARGAHP